jgi:RNA polymerase sigma factor (sigma-70 family)
MGKAIRNMASILEQDRQISEAMAAQATRLQSFIRSRVPRGADVEDIVQEVFYELVRAHRLLMPIDTVTGWLFRVARNRITDLFRKKTPELFSELAQESEDGEPLEFEDLLSSDEAGPEEQLARGTLLQALEAALAELPPEQREVFVAHELEGRSFKELSAEYGVSINTLLSRKRYAVLGLRERLEGYRSELVKK